MKKSMVVWGLSVLAIATSSHAGSVSTLDLTGTWLGKGSCAALADGDKLKSSNALSVEISRSGDTDAAAFNFLPTGGFPLGVVFEGCGFTAAENEKPDRGRAAIHGYDDGAPFAVFGTADISKVNVFPVDKKGRSGKMKGTVLVAVRDVFDAIVSCKFTADRTSQVDPGISACLAPTMGMVAAE